MLGLELHEEQVQILRVVLVEVVQEVDNELANAFLALVLLVVENVTGELDDLGIVLDQGAVGREDLGQEVEESEVFVEVHFEWQQVENVAEDLEFTKLVSWK